MSRFALSLLTVLLLANAVVAQKIETVKIRLNHVQPSDFVHTLKTANITRSTGGGDSDVQEPLLPFGIKNVVAYNADNSLLVTGTAEAITQFRDIVRLYDVKPRIVLLKMRLMEARFAADGKRSEKTLQTPILTTVNNGTGKVSVTGRGGYEIEVTPHINGDNSITLSMNWNLRILQNGNRQITRTVQRTRRTRAGQTLRLAVPFVPDSGGLSNEQPPQGSAIDDFKPKEPGSLYYLEILPSEITLEQSATP